jgi:DNA-binding transcriptional MocR family regulator
MSGKVFGEGFAIVPDSVLLAEISANGVRLWALLQRHSDPEGRCYPGRKRMAQLLGVSEDTITRAKRELAEAGLLLVKERFDAEGRRTTDDLFLRQARRKFAATGRRTGAAAEQEPEELEPPSPSNQRAVGANARALGTNPRARRAPTDTSPILPWVPEEPATAEERQRAAQKLREISTTALRELLEQDQDTAS